MWLQLDLILSVAWFSGFIWWFSFGISVDCCLTSQGLQASQYVASVESSSMIIIGLIRDLFFFFCPFIDGLGNLTIDQVLEPLQERESRSGRIKTSFSPSVIYY